jgi:Tfp pilus assembly protein PilZ
VVVPKRREKGGEGLGEPGAGPAGVVDLSVDYPARDEFEAAFAREIFGGAVFVPTLDRLPAGQRVRVTFDLLFCKTRFELDGEVVASLPASIASAGVAPGVSVQFCEPPAELRAHIERASEIRLRDASSLNAEFPRAEPRYATQAPALLEIRGRRLSAQTADVSYNGMLALLPGVDLGDVTDLCVAIEHPGSGERIELDCRIANQTPCDDGMMVLGLQFVYDLERVDEVARFVDDLRGFHHARALATVSGSLVDTRLETVLETFAGVSNSGTLRLSRGDEQGKIVYQEGEILYVTMGLLSGAKALDRLFTWDDAQFEFRSEVEPMDGVRGLLPLTPAVLAAVVARDELAQLDLSGFDSNATFAVDRERLAAVASTLDEIGREIAECARMGFPLGAMLDMLACSDARIYKTVGELTEAGVLRIKRD